MSGDLIVKHFEDLTIQFTENHELMKGLVSQLEAELATMCEKCVAARKAYIWDSLKEVRTQYHFAEQPLGRVYFVAQVEGGPIKIGFSRNLHGRLSALQLSNATELKLLLAIHGTLETEKEFHKRFAFCRLHGEWFKPHPQLTNFIRLQAASKQKVAKKGTVNA